MASQSTLAASLLRQVSTQARSPFSSIWDFPDLVEATTPAVAWVTPRDARCRRTRLVLSLSAFTWRRGAGRKVGGSRQAFCGSERFAHWTAFVTPSYFGCGHQLSGAGCYLVGTHHQLLELALPLHHQIRGVPETRPQQHRHHAVTTPPPTQLRPSLDTADTQPQQNHGSPSKRRERSSELTPSLWLPSPPL